MKAIVTYLQERDILFKSFKEITPKTLGSRKKIDIYIATDLKAYYTLVIKVEKKSRLLKKEALEYIALHLKAQDHLEHTITKKHIIIDAPLCSKAKATLEENGWKVWKID